MDTNAVVKTLETQRNQALNQVAELSGINAALARQIQELTDRIADLEEAAK